MGYQVLARKYRPGQFSDVIAQEHVTRTLRNALIGERVGSAYLFCGPRGTGKTTCARILAKAINCLTGPTAEPCGSCASCREISSGSSLDVLEIDAASNTGVDDIRTLRENIRYLPTTGKRRIYIIDEVHRLSSSAFDALLKTLEEPPAHVVFMFATTDPLKLPDTILSRTQRFDFKRVTIDHLAAHLKQLAGMEGIEATTEALRLIARKGDGSVRDSLSLLDQVIAYCGTTIAEADVVSALGLVDRELLVTCLRQAIAQDQAGILRTVIAASEGGLDSTEFLAELQEELRLLLLLKSDPTFQQDLPLSSSEAAERLALVEQIAIGDLLRMIQIVTGASADSRGQLDAQLVLEVAMVRLATLTRTIDLQQLLRELSVNPVERPHPNPSPAQEPQHKPIRLQAPAPEGPKRPISVPAQSMPAQSLPDPGAAILSPGRFKAGWSDLIAHVRKLHPMLATQLELGTPGETAAGQLVVRFGLSGKTAAGYLAKPDSAEVLRRAVLEIYRVEATMTGFVDESAIEAQAEQLPHAGDLLAASPRLRKLVEKVNGEIIGVKRVE